MMTPAVDSRRNIPALRPATIAENHIRWPTVFGGLAIHSVAMNSALIADIKTRSGVVIEVTTASSKRCDIVSEGYKLAMNDLSYERDRPRCVAVPEQQLDETDVLPLRRAVAHKPADVA